MTASYARSVASGSTDTFSVPFGYLDKTHVKIYRDDVLAVVTTDYTWPTDGTIQFVAGNPAAGVVVERRRETPTDTLVTFTPGNLSSVDLNTGNLQPLYLAQEADDRARDHTARAWFTSELGAGGLITKGATGTMPKFDASGNMVEGPSAADIAASEASAAASATSAANSATTATTKEASMTARLLGSYANDAAALVAHPTPATGARYFNTTTNSDKVWNGTAFVAAPDVPDGSVTAPKFAADFTEGVWLPAYLSILSSAKGGDIELALMKQAGAWLDLGGLDGSEAVTDAAWVDAYDAAVNFRLTGNQSKGATIHLPAGALRINTPMKITDNHIKAKGQGHAVTVIVTDRNDIDMVGVEGATGTGAAVTHSDWSGVSLIRLSTLTSATSTSPKQLTVRNATNGIYDDIFIQKAMIGVYLDRATDNHFTSTFISGLANDIECYAGVWHTSVTGRAGVSFSNYFDKLELNYRKAGVDAGFTYGVRIDCADGLYFSNGHILDQRHNVALLPDNVATVKDKLGGFRMSDFYIDRATENCLLIGGAADLYARLMFHRTRFSLAGTNGVRMENSLPIDEIEFDDCHFLLAGEKGFYAVSGATRAVGLKIGGSRFAQNNTAATAAGGDMILNGLESYDIFENSFLTGNAAGTAISVGTTVGAGSIEGNDISASTSGTKLSILGDNNGRKITNNREVATGWSEIEREGVVQTTSATPSAVWNTTVQENQTVEVEFTARASHLAKGSAATIKRVAIYNRATAGSAVEEGDVAVWEAEDDVGYGITIALSGNVVQTSVVGLAATTVNWHWNVKYRVRTA